MSLSYRVIFLTILIFNFSWSVLAGNYPIVGVTLLQSAPGSDVYGKITLTQPFEGAGVVIEGLILNLKPFGRFGLHVHERGDITDACHSPGAHFNPYGKHHGREQGSERHWGDFGNVMSDGAGTARVFLNIADGSLIGADSYIGRTLVIHEHEDDLGLTMHELSKKTGNAGGRLACGVIGIYQPIDLLPIPQQQLVPQQSQMNINNQRSLGFLSKYRRRR